MRKQLCALPLFDNSRLALKHFDRADSFRFHFGTLSTVRSHPCYLPIMTSTPMTSATESISRGSTSRLPTSTPSSPPTDVSHHGDRTDESEELADGVSKSMIEEEKKLQTAVSKEEEERAAALQAEREKDAAGGEDVIDPKFKRLEFLLKQSSVSLDACPARRG